MKNLYRIILFVLVFTVQTVKFQAVSVQTNNLTVKEIKKVLEENIPKSEDIFYEEVPRGLILSISDDLLFIEQDNYLWINPQAYGFLDVIAALFSQLDNNYTIEGHSDETFPHAEWEYSMIKSDLIVKYLIIRNPKLQNKVFAVGFGDREPFHLEFKKADSGNLNNRIDFVIIQYEARR